MNITLILILIITAISARLIYYFIEKHLIENKYGKVPKFEYPSYEEIDEKINNGEKIEYIRYCRAVDGKVISTDMTNMILEWYYEDKEKNNEQTSTIH